jgi:hypothetical protein
VRGVTGKPRRRGGERQGLLPGGVFGAGLQDPADQRDADGLGFQRTPAGRIDPAGSPFSDQPLMPQRGAVPA